MTLASVEELDRLIDAVGREVQVRGGGSAANTAVGLASLGVDTAIVTQVGDDDLGEQWAREVAEAGAEVVLLATPPGSRTARSLIMVDEGGERTMVTSLGVAASLDVEELPLPLLAEARWCFVEGYLLDAAPEGLFERLDVVRRLGGRIALSLGDALLVDRHRDRLLKALGRVVDVVLGNGAEAAQLVRRQGLATIVEELQARGVEGGLTLGADGAVVFSPDEALHQPAPVTIDDAVDTTGAGDQFAAGFLAAMVRGGDLASRAMLGTHIATAVVTHEGARPRPDTPLLAAPELTELLSSLRLGLERTETSD